MAETEYSINHSGQDYDDLSAFDAGEAGDITAGNAKVAVIYDDDGDLADSVVFSGLDWTTDVDSYIGVRARVSNRHNGTPGSGVVLKSDGASPLTLGPEYFLIEWLEVHGDGNNVILFDLTNMTGSPLAIIQNCLLHNSGTAYAIHYNAAATASIRNCFVFDVARAAYAFSAAANVDILNITIYSTGAYGILRAVAINCYAGGATTEDFFALVAGSDYCVSSDTSASDECTNNATGKTSYTDYFNSIAGGSEDLHLKNTSNNLWGLSGTDLSGTFTIDIDGETRSAWDVGGHEFPAAVGVVPQIQWLRMNTL